MSIGLACHGGHLFARLRAAGAHVGAALHLRIVELAAGLFAGATDSGACAACLGVRGRHPQQKIRTRTANLGAVEQSRYVFCFSVRPAKMQAMVHRFSTLGGA